MPLGFGNSNSNCYIEKSSSNCYKGLDNSNSNNEKGSEISNSNSDTGLDKSDIQEISKKQMENSKIEKSQDLESFSKTQENHLDKMTILGFENVNLLKIIICATSISIFFFFVFLRGNILLKSFANIT